MALRPCLEVRHPTAAVLMLSELTRSAVAVAPLHAPMARTVLTTAVHPGHSTAHPGCSVRAVPALSPSLSSIVADSPLVGGVRSAEYGDIVQGIHHHPRRCWASSRAVRLASNEGLEQTRSALTTPAAALAAQPWCSPDRMTAGTTYEDRGRGCVRGERSRAVQSLRMSSSKVLPRSFPLLPMVPRW